MAIAGRQGTHVHADGIHRLRVHTGRERLGGGGRDGGVGIVGEEDEGEGRGRNSNLAGVAGGIALDGLDIKVAREAAVRGERGAKCLLMVDFRSGHTAQRT